jgi:hypothetical protein
VNLAQELCVWYIYIPHIKVPRYRTSQFTTSIYIYIHVLIYTLGVEFYSTPEPTRRHQTSKLTRPGNPPHPLPLIGARPTHPRSPDFIPPSPQRFSYRRRTSSGEWRSFPAYCPTGSLGERRPQGLHLVRGGPVDSLGRGSHGSSLRRPAIPGSIEGMASPGGPAGTLGGRRPQGLPPGE